VTHFMYFPSSWQSYRLGSFVEWVKIVSQFCVLLKEYTRDIIVRVLVAVKRKESQTLNYFRREYSGIFWCKLDSLCVCVCVRTCARASPSPLGAS
jgi:hypothetical protein